jgi:hypothetical protein
VVKGAWDQISAKELHDIACSRDEYSWVVQASSADEFDFERAQSYVSGGIEHGATRDGVSGRRQAELLGAMGLLLPSAAAEEEEVHLLEYGCGTLDFAKHVLPHVSSYACVEPNEWLPHSALHRARANTNNDDLERVLLDAFAPEGSASMRHALDFNATDFGTQFNVVHSHSVLSHAGLRQIQQFFDSAASVMSPSNGVLVSSLCVCHPCGPRLDDNGSDKHNNAAIRQQQQDLWGAAIATAECHSSHDLEWNYDYVSYYTPDELDAAIRKSGLVPLHVNSAFTAAMREFIRGSGGAACDWHDWVVAITPGTDTTEIAQRLAMNTTIMMMGEIIMEMR